MAMTKCKYCRKWYNENVPHNCIIQQQEQKVNNRLKQRKYYAENKDSESYKAIHSLRWRRFRKQVIIADGGFCQRCFAKKGIYNFNDLEVHHIIPRATAPELAYDEDNVITLCKTCNLELGLNGIDFEWSPANRHINNEIHLG